MTTNGRIDDPAEAEKKAVAFREACEQFDVRYALFEPVYRELSNLEDEIDWRLLEPHRFKVESAYGDLARLWGGVSTTGDKVGSEATKDVVNSRRIRARHPFDLLWRVYEKNSFHLAAKKRYQTRDLDIIQDIVTGVWEQLQNPTTAASYEATRSRWITWASYRAWSSSSRWQSANRSCFVITDDVLRRQLPGRLVKISILSEQISVICKCLASLCWKRTYCDIKFASMIRKRLAESCDWLQSTDVEWTVQLLGILCFRCHCKAGRCRTLRNSVGDGSEPSIEEAAIVFPPNLLLEDRSRICLWLEAEYESNAESAACFYMRHYADGTRELKSDIHLKLEEKFPLMVKELRDVENASEQHVDGTDLPRIEWVQISACVFDSSHAHTAKNCYIRKSLPSLKKFLETPGLSGDFA